MKRWFRNAKWRATSVKIFSLKCWKEISLSARVASALLRWISGGILEECLYTFMFSWVIHRLSPPTLPPSLQCPWKHWGKARNECCGPKKPNCFYWQWRIPCSLHLTLQVRGSNPDTGCAAWKRLNHPNLRQCEQGHYFCVKVVS